MAEGTFDFLSTPEWVLLSPPEMSEGVADTSKPKRKRDNTLLKGSGIVHAGTWFVCSYCGNTTPKALVPSSVIKGVAFDTFPCGLAWICEHASDATVSQTTRDAFCKLYSQPPGLAIAAPPTTDLIQFGGKLTADTWLPNASLWQQLTQNMGVTIAEVPSARGKKAKAKAAGAVVSFEVGMYVIPIKGAPKLVNAVDGAPKKPGDLTAVGAQRKLNKFATANPAYTVTHFDTDKFSVSGCTGVSDTVNLNNTATQLAQTNVYGPAIALFTRKVSLKV